MVSNVHIHGVGGVDTPDKEQIVSVKCALSTKEQDDRRERRERHMRAIQAARKHADSWMKKYRKSKRTKAVHKMGKSQTD